MTARRATAISASAGSGKTFQLTNGYIGLLLDGVSPDKILATTFTRKAAGEILQRVLTRLARAARSAEECARLARELELPALEVRAVETLLLRFVRQLHRVRIQTIDSFFAGMARSFALELGIPSDWTVIEKEHDERLRRAAIETMLRSDEAGDDDLTFQLRMLSRGRAKRSVVEEVYDAVDKLYGLYAETPRDAWCSLERPAQFDATELARCIEDIANLAHGSSAMDLAIIENVEQARRGRWSDLLGKGVAAKVLENQQEFWRKPIPGEVFDAYDRLFAHVRAVLARQLADQTEATYRLLDQFHRHYQALKLRERSLRFDDVTRVLSSATIMRNLDEVFYRLDTRIAHVLFDEFQDTSLAQWLVLRPLAAEAAADASGERSLFCVGDVKQAIYAWRGGIAEIFTNLGNELPGLTWSPLNQSYRSSPAVIDTVNWVFGGLERNIVFQHDPERVKAWADRFEKHTTARTELPGHATMTVAPEAADGEVQRTRTLEFAAERVAEIIRESPGRSVGVLVQTNSAVARLIHSLRARGVAARDESGDRLTDSSAVGLITSALTLADHPGDTVARFHLARSPLGPTLGVTNHVSDETAHAASTRIRESLTRDGYGRTVRAWVNALAPECDASDTAKLHALAALAFEYDADATLRPGDFVRRLQAQRIEDPSRSRVRVMTIHKAKGLEFDIVVLPELDRRLVPPGAAVLTDRHSPTAPPTRIVRYARKSDRAAIPELEGLYEQHVRRAVRESLGVLYVALTRAVHALHMIIAPNASSRVPDTFAGVLRGALAARKPAVLDARLYDHGDARWFAIGRTEATRASVVDVRMPSIPSSAVTLAPPASRRRARGRTSPSALDGGNQVRLAARLRLDRTAADHGIIFHAFFERIEWVDGVSPGDDALRALARSLGADDANATVMVGEFRAMLERPDVAAALTRGTFATRGLLPRVYRELPYALREGEWIMSGKLDRLVVCSDAEGRAVDAEILDFKTDSVRPDEIRGRAKHYAPQIDAYRRAVGRMFKLPVEKVHARLLFVREGTAVSM